MYDFGITINSNYCS